ncbi:MAG TPA: DNA translocase FtsK 4TM domain-containing protein [Thermoanaerobaculia bacterium]|nr:DNA translocase FtsK 4TM domain-containing protein [Thermoanaerobaculia bacterium]
MAQGTFWRGRIASEALGVLLVLVGVLTALSLLSFDPRDPNLFSVTAGGEAASPSNWIGGFGASLSAALYALVGLGAWGVPVLLLIWGWRMFSQRPVENPATKAAGFALLFVSIPALLSLGLGRRSLFGEQAEAGGVVGRAIADAARGRLGTTGAALLAAALLLIAVPLSTQVSLAEVFAGLRIRFAGLLSRMRIGWVRRRDRRTKERLRRAVVAKHIEKARREPVTLGEVPFVADEGTAQLREVPGEGRFSIRKTTSPSPANAAPPAPVRPLKKEPQQSLPLPGLDGYPYPDASLLDKRDAMGIVDRKVLAETGKSIAARCAEFGVEGEIVEYHPGPVVTTYEFRPATGIKVNQVMSLSEDLALSLSAESIRIERLPGRASVGIEVPNPGGGEIISLRDVIESDRFRRSPSLLTLALGKDIHGEPVVDDLRSMPHLLIAGTTGSGKSVSINALLTSILFKARPDQVKLILVDPKMVELEIYEHLPHLMTPIIIDPKKAANALKWAVGVMDDRFQTLSDVGQVRNAEQYNAAIRDPDVVKRVRAEHPDDPELKLDPMPLIVIVIDELADLMMTAPKEVEESIVRLAQKARAVGIHLVVATQRPSADVVTGLIKANFSSRIAFKVSSRVDSRVILDGNGAERLLGRGDMLVRAPGTSRLKRVHGAFVSIQESARLVNFLRKQGKPQYDDSITKEPAETAARDDSGDETDPLYDEAARLVVKEKMASISFLQRRMGVGFSRAGKLIDLMSRDGLLGPPRGSKPREVLVSEDYFEEVDRQPR